MCVSLVSSSSGLLPEVGCAAGCPVDHTVRNVDIPLGM